MENHEQDIEITKLQANQNSMAEKIDALTELVKGEFASLRKEIKLNHDEVKLNYVSNDRFLPVKILTYGFAGILFTAVVVALVSSVIK